MADGIDANAAVASAKKALHDADNFGQRETGNKKAGDPPSYTQARAARKAADSTESAKPVAKPAGEFMGIRSDESNELNTALAAREDAKKALGQ